ncbi:MULTISPECIES: hypothetical protein [unclassified Nonomuraea]|uniref:hypothetical protein n=1 Tax=unclassified Nonomuraea TaxID=2593643 RepID=UPI0033F857FD
MQLKTKIAGILMAALAMTSAATPVRAATTQNPPQGTPRSTLTAAADQIRKVVDGGGYAGVELGEDRVILWWKGKVPGPIRAAIQRAEKIAPVEVRPAAYSQSELSAASDRLWAASGAEKGGRVHAVQMPFDGSGLTAAVEEKDKALVRQALPDVGVPVQVVAQEPLQLTSRCDDDLPWYGGVAIANATFGGAAGCGGSPALGYNCTGGFPVYIGSTRYLLTAGHCGAPGDVFTDGAGQVIGVAEQENVAHDLLLIRVTGLVSTGKGNGRMWDGTPGVSDFTKPVAGWGFTYKNQSLCMSGATTGASCGRTVDYKYSEICGKDIYGNQECYSNLVSAKQRIDSSRHGDSGGPVFELTGGDAQVRAMGTVTGTITKDWIITKDQWLLFQEFATAVRDFPGLEPALDLGPDPA